ncbi:hypothetical protein JEQ12_017417 [Ovis aries]|uniref:Uncharacterized protein n=1 Tax=Ovis aries TaxID=9940 RepID=A0A836A4I2_SHEEP|nr:hypothetical protein JEQ12_017417 [Ovis aries]
MSGSKWFASMSLVTVQNVLRKSLLSGSITGIQHEKANRSQSLEDRLIAPMVTLQLGLFHSDSPICHIGLLCCKIPPKPTSRNKKWEKGKKRNPSLLLAFQRTDLALQLLYRKIQVGPHGGHLSVEDAVTARELYRPVQVQWEPQAASSLRAPAEDRQPDSSTDTEQYMEDQYWPEDPAQGTSGDTGEAPGRRE